LPLIRARNPPTFIQSLCYDHLQDKNSCCNSVHIAFERCNSPALPILLLSWLNMLYRDKVLSIVACGSWWGICSLYRRCCFWLDTIMVTEVEISKAVPLDSWDVEHALMCDCTGRLLRITYCYILNVWAVCLWAYVFNFLIRDGHAAYVVFYLLMLMHVRIALSLKSILILLLSIFIDSGIIENYNHTCIY
jgi:hypothetical protein